MPLLTEKVSPLKLYLSFDAEFSKQTMQQEYVCFVLIYYINNFFRSPHEKKKKKGLKSLHQFKGSSCSPSASPDRAGAMARVSASPSPVISPTSSLGRSR